MFALTLALVLGSAPVEYTPPPPSTSTEIGLTPERWELIESAVFVSVFSLGLLVAVKL